VFARFSDPALQARYNEDHQRREQEAKASFNSGDAATRNSARIGAPAESTPGKDRDARSFFETSEIKRRAAEEQARQREQERQKGMQQGGGRSR
jgi:hypothetical protein